MLKCPHCNGFLVLEKAGTGSSGQVDRATPNLVSRVSRWLDTPVSVSDLLLESGFNGDLTPYEPLDRMVVRTAFRAKDCLSALRINATAHWLAFYMGHIPGWSPATTKTRYWGLQGRWWVKTGYEWAPGFVEADDDLI